MFHDKGRNFESYLFQQGLSALGIQKSRTAAYHPQGMGWLKDLIILYFSCYGTWYTETEDDWDKFLPMVMYTYRTAKYSLTNLSPFELIHI